MESRYDGTLYGDMLAAGVSLDNHESDLYAKITPESQAIVGAYKFKSNVRTFRSQIDGTLWYDIPFAFLPWWERRMSAVSR